MEVATARVYNWDVGQRRKEKGGGDDDGDDGKGGGGVEGWNGMSGWEEEKEVGRDPFSFFFPSREDKKKKRNRSCSRAIIIDISVQESKQDKSPSLVKKY